MRTAVGNNAPQNVVTDISHYPSGAIAGQTFGNGLSLAVTFDGRQRPRDWASGPFLNETLDYHQIGTVAAVTDHTSFNDSSSFAYDALNRLTNVGGYGLRAITYDDLGNQLTNGANTYAIDASTLRMTYRWGSPNNGAFGYNSVGSLTSDPEGRAFTYTGLEALKTATVLGQTTSYQYDGDGMRTVRRDESSGEERYLLHGPGTQLRAEYKRVSDTLVPVREYLSIGDRIVASVDQIAGPPPSSCTTTFTDDPIVANVTPVKALHTTELRTVINCVRSWYGLGAYSWTDPTITADVTVVSAVHVEQMRTALNEAYTQAGLTPPSYADPGSLANVGIKALHFNQLRQAVRDLPPPQPTTTAMLRYYHTDPLGSVRAITDANGAQVERRDYYAFGDSQPLEGNPIRFTGKELDVPNVGLTYFGARYYTHVDARFTTVDPLVDIGASVFDPQQWNRYAYVLNDPTTLVDPLGLRPITFRTEPFTFRTVTWGWDFYDPIETYFWLHRGIRLSLPPADERGPGKLARPTGLPGSRGAGPGPPSDYKYPTTSCRPSSSGAFGFFGKGPEGIFGPEGLLIAGHDNQQGFFYGAIVGFVAGPITIGLESIRYTRNWTAHTSVLAIGSIETPWRIASGHVGFGGFMGNDGSHGAYGSLGAVGGGYYGGCQ